MPSEKSLPKEIKYPNDHRRGIPMKINYNKASILLQGSGHLIEEVDGPI
jgi:hypothetical protein